MSFRNEMHSRVNWVASGPGLMPRRVRDGPCDHVQGAVCRERLMTGTEGELASFPPLLWGASRRVVQLLPASPVSASAHIGPKGCRLCSIFKQSLWEGEISPVDHFGNVMQLRNSFKVLLLKRS